MREVLKLGEGWRFHDGDLTEGQSVDYDDSSWEAVSIPHDWAIKRPLVFREADIQLSLNILDDDPKEAYASAQGFYDRWGVGWYRNKLELNLAENEVAYLNFDGIFHESTVYLDGEKIGARRYGYSAFSVPVNSGMLAVRVDNTPEHAADRWYSGCGIYRPATLTVCDKLHVKEWGTTISSDNISEKSADVNVTAEVQNEYDHDCSVDIKVEIVSPEGDVCAQKKLTATVPADNTEEVCINFEIDKPSLWWIENPNLYLCRISIIKDNKKLIAVMRNSGYVKQSFSPEKDSF